MTKINNVSVIVNAICKNEDKKIENWLNGVKDADAIFILIANNEKDSTIPVIEKFISANPIIAAQDTIRYYTDSTYEDIKTTGFSVPRNRILANAKAYANYNTDFEHEICIILTLDIDESLEEGTISRLKEIILSRPTDFIGKDAIAIRGSSNTGDDQIILQKMIIYNKDNFYMWKGYVHEEFFINDKSEKTWKIVDLTNNIRYIHEQDTTKERNYYEMIKIALSKDTEKDDPRLLSYAAWEAFNHEEYENGYAYNLQCRTAVLTKNNERYYKDPQIYLQTFFNDYVYYSNKEIKNYDDACKYHESLSELMTYQHQCENFNIGYIPTRLTQVICVKMYYRYINSMIIIGYKDYLESVSMGIIQFLFSCYKKFIETKYAYYGWIDKAEYYHSNYNQIEIDIANTLYLLYQAMRYKVDKRRILELSVGFGVLALEKAIPDTDNYAMCFNNLKYYKEALKMILNEKENIHIEESNVMGISNDNIESTNESKPVKANKICVYAITKNESQFVDRWYESMKEADAIVVLDTGSTDDTVEKLRAHGVTVKVQTISPWRFDVPRNIAMEMVPEDCNILISTDLDEVLEPGWADIIRKNWIDGLHERGVYKYSWSHLSNGESGRIFRYDKIHTKNWKWRYPVHELLWNENTNSNLYDSDVTLDLFDAGVHLHHYPDYSKPRSSYLPLLELRAEENPDDYYGLIYLAHEYFYREKYDKSIETLKKVLNKFIAECTSVEEASCYLFMGDAYAELKKFNESKDSYLKAISIDPTYREPYLNMAKVLETEGSFDIAKAYIIQGMKNSYRHYTWLERDASWSYEPYDLLSLACYYSGDKKNAILYAMIASDMDSENTRLSDNVKIIKESISLDEIL